MEALPNDGSKLPPSPCAVEDDDGQDFSSASELEELPDARKVLKNLKNLIRRPLAWAKPQ